MATLYTLCSKIALQRVVYRMLREILFQHEYTIKKPLMVVAPVETMPETASHPVGASESVSFGGCCCRGKLAAEAQLPKSTYFPGEFVIGSLKIDNRHPRHIVDQVYLYFILHHSNCTNKELCGNERLKYVK